MLILLTYLSEVKLLSRRILGLGFISTLVSLAFPALAASKPTLKCRFVGQTTVYKGKLYTCIKVRSKGRTVLAWDSGKLIATPAQPQATSPSASPTPSKSSEPIVVKKIDIPIANSSEVPNNSAVSFTAKNRYGNSTTYILIRNSDGLLAMDATCPHKGCIVAVEREGLLCPCHNALFDAKNGAVLRGPASYPLDRVAVREENGTIYLSD